ncbi:TPA: helix-turn-helix domain-containing protein [Acinetobacter baumannii]|jgi:transcriptional regulator with XRE-family HTH domain|uniref:helix-turn-helix domain-containing protein n=1 Tax=Acinetobacter TaxID=469 RepID=UPI000C344183|nr:helix-turn-helix transcriptional regulator [Acinetobacter radioresistens]PKH31648.1 hypothetical protein BJF94_06740 [Acinetobacter radioresistens]HBI1384549.1 helix-turn-helix domain-containing protein [Acinetobacter baumannii]HBI9064007.1 helix-turn-helix domain-containing protein [Acinetobacter baumannii]
MNILNHYLGAVLAGIREGRKITQTELGQSLRCSGSFISNIERGSNGEISRDMVEFYSQHLQVPVDEIYNVAMEYQIEYSSRDGMFYEITRDIIKRRLKAKYDQERLDPRTRTIFDRRIRH